MLPTRRNFPRTDAAEAMFEAVHLSTHLDPDLHKQMLGLLRTNYLKTPLVVTSLRNLGLRQGALDHSLLVEIGETNASNRVRAMAWRAIISGRSSYIDKWQVFIGTKEARDKQNPEMLRGMLKSVAAWEKDIAEAKAKLKAPDLIDALPDISIGAKAPATIAVNLEGKKVSLADHKGKVVLIDFWHTKCGPCLEMIPANNALVQELKGRPFVFIGISADESRETVAAFRGKTKIFGEQWWAGFNSELTENWNVEGYPTTYVVDHEGVIRHIQSGYDAKTDKLAEIVKELVKKAEADRK